MKYLLLICIIPTSFIPVLADDKTPQWRWEASQSSLLWCVYHQITYSRDPKLTCEITSPNTGNPLQHFKVRILSSGEELCAFDAHPLTVFIRKEHMLYVADFHYISTGCSIIAFDLKQRKQLWKTNLKGLELKGNDKYSNAVNLQYEKDQLIVYGKESAGRYIETLDPATGKTLSNTKLPAER